MSAKKIVNGLGGNIGRKNSISCVAIKPIERVETEGGERQREERDRGREPRDRRIFDFSHL